MFEGVQPAAVTRLAASDVGDQPDGLAGNEDCGQMSAWYVISALGFYAVDPASGNYVFGGPMFDRAIAFVTFSGGSAGNISKQVGELCHGKALVQTQASKQSLTRVRICWRISLDGKWCMRLNQRSVGEYTTALTG